MSLWDRFRRRRPLIEIEVVIEADGQYPEERLTLRAWAHPSEMDAKLQEIAAHLCMERSRVILGRYRWRAIG